MKTCPDCAESVQDAARKCRFCGFRFDEGDEDASEEPRAPDVAPANQTSPSGSVGNAPTRSRPAAPAWAGTALTVGGLVLGLGALLLGIANLAELPTLAGVGVIGTGLGALGLGLGWSAVLPSGRAGLSLVIGSFLACAMVAAGFIIPSAAPEWALLGRYLMYGGMLVCAMVHTFGLESPSLGLAKFGAGLGLAGLGLFMTNETRAWDLPEGIALAMGVAGLTGLVLLGLGLASGASRLVRR